MPLSPSYNAYIPSNVSAFVQLPLANRTQASPHYVPFDEIDKLLKPLQEKYKLSRQYVERINSPSILNHNLRMICYAFALLHTGFPSQVAHTVQSGDSTEINGQISAEELTERIYLSCMLHDLGTTRDPNTLSHPAHTMSFEFFSGFLAYDHLHSIKHAHKHPNAVNLDDVFISDIVQSTFLHTSFFTTGFSSSTAGLLHLCAFLDVGGWDVFGPDVFPKLWNKRTVTEIEERFPRLEIAEQAADGMERMLREKPDCVLSHYVSSFILF
jgi:hypothetical protein